MGSPHGYDAGLEFDELLGLAIDRGSGGIAPGIRLTNAQTNLGQQSLLSPAGGVTLANVTTAQDIFVAAHNVTLQANTVYMFEGQFVLNQGAGAGACNIQLSFVASTALAYIGYQAFSLAIASDSPAVAGTGGSTTNGIATAAVTLLGAATATPVKLVEVMGTFKTGNAVTTLRPQVTYTVAPGAAPTTEAGGFMNFYPVVSQ